VPTNQATTADLSARSLRPLTPAEAAWAEVALDDAFRQILVAVPDLGDRLDDPDLPADAPLRRVVVQVTCTMLLRVLANPDGLLEETIDDHTRRLDASVRPGRCTSPRARSRCSRAAAARPRAPSRSGRRRGSCAATAPGNGSRRPPTSGRGRCERREHPRRWPPSRERLMTSRCRIIRLHEVALDTASLTLTDLDPSDDLVYEGPCRLKTTSLAVTTATPRGRSSRCSRSILSLPVSVGGVRVGDRVEITDGGPTPISPAAGSASRACTRRPKRPRTATPSRPHEPA
jgi:hypothetical protein